MAGSKTLTRYTGAALLFAARMSSALNFTVSNGQIYTPGLVIVDAPQPGTPLGGGLSSAIPLLFRVLTRPRPH
jgi:hypothetical protein